ncbi:MAG: hypothetical protein WCF36_18715 [Candidatus Nanopelagicales bacterium]
MKRIAGLSSVLIALVLAVTVAGCGSAEPEAEQRSPSDVAALYLEAMRGNVAGLREHNPDTEITEEGVFGSANSSMLETWGVRPSAEQEAQITEAMLAGLSEVEFTVVDEKVDGESATVTVAIRGIDMSSSLDTQFATIGGQITEDTEDVAIIAVLDQAWREAPLMPEPTNVDMPFVAVSDGRWIADPQGGEAAAAAYVKFAG